MKRLINIRTAYSQSFDTFDFDGVWKDVFGDATKTGVWIAYGAEKNGKTWFALKLADMLSRFERTLYVSGEEGLDKDFIAAMKRAQLEPDNGNLYLSEYVTLEALSRKLKKRQAARVVVIDNVTIYKDELSYGGFQKFAKEHEDILIIFIAHEERNEPYTATAKMIKRLAKIIIRVQGLACFISGRCPGGTLMIDEQKAMLYHGNSIKD